MKKYFIYIFLWFSFFPSFAQESQDICLDYFTGENCLECSDADEYIESLEIHYENLSVNWYDIHLDKKFAGRLSDLFQQQNVPIEERQIPAAFIGEKYFVGEIQKSELENEIRNLFKNANVPCPEPLATSADDHEILLPLISIITAALVDSINPCAIAVLLILLTALMATQDRKRAIKTGLAFTASIFISYFLFGLGLFSAIQVSGLSYWFYKAVGFLAILIGLGNIKDYFWYGGGGFVMEIPRSWRPRMKKILRGVTSPWGAFAMGFVVCLFELPCTGGPYLFILGLLAEKGTRMQAIPILLLYNLFFVLPLLVISGLVYFGYTTVEDTNKWKNRNFKLFHLIIGLIMLALGLLVVFEVL